jgi:septal ring factor EnvC (AmiA/AmiB activator)
MPNLTWDIILTAAVAAGGYIVLLKLTAKKIDDFCEHMYKKMDKVDSSLILLQVQQGKTDTTINALSQDVSVLRDKMNKVERDITNVIANNNLTSVMVKRLEKDTENHAGKIAELQQRAG